MGTGVTPRGGPRPPLRAPWPRAQGGGSPALCTDSPPVPGTRTPEHRPSVALVHDYLTQRGGAERVVLSLLHAFPEAPVHTALYRPEQTFPELRFHRIEPSALNKVAWLRRDHRLAFPFLAPAMGHRKVDADVVVCSSSGWAHGVRTTGKKVVYCHTPARWLYQSARYLGANPPWSARVALGALAAPLRRWDRRAAQGAHRYLVNSRAVRHRVQQLYGIDAEVVPPPPTFTPHGPAKAVPGVEPGYWLCVSRLLPYKNVGQIMAAFDQLGSQRLVVVGSGPQAQALAARAGSNVTLVGQVDDTALRWLYTNCQGVVAASYEDFGLTPLEAATFGKPAAVLRWGGFLDTVVSGRNGLFFDQPRPQDIAGALRAMAAEDWSSAEIQAHADAFSEERFIQRLRAIVGQELAQGAPPQGPSGHRATPQLSGAQP